MLDMELSVLDMGAFGVDMGAFGGAGHGSFRC